MRVVLFLVAGCVWTAPAPTPAPTTTPPVPATRRQFVVEPNELGDHDVLARMPHRARVQRIGNAWLRATGEPLESTAREEPEIVLPVIATTESRVRVVTPDGGHDAWLALWIERADLWSVIVRRVQLAELPIWLERGAPIETLDRGVVRLVDSDVVIEGKVPAGAIGKLWEAAPGDPDPDVHQDTPCCERRKGDRGEDHVELAAGTNIRASRHAGSKVIARTTASVTGSVVRRDGSQLELEIMRPYATIRGFVEASATKPSWAWRSTGMYRGSSLYVTHSDRISVPAGTCLFDAASGEVIGVQRTADERWGRLNAQPGWSMIYVSTRWGTADLYVHDVGSDPKQPQWESCRAQP